MVWPPPDEPDYALKEASGAKRGARHQADLVSACSVKMVFMVSAPLVITGLS